MRGNGKTTVKARLLLAMVVCLVLVLSLRFPVGAEEPDFTEGESALTFDEIAHGRVVLWLGGAHEKLARKAMPEAELMQAYTTVDMGIMVRQNKADAFVMSESYVRYIGEKDYAQENTENQLAWKLLYRHVTSFGQQESPEKPYTKEAYFMLKKDENN